VFPTEFFLPFPFRNKEFAMKMVWLSIIVALFVTVPLGCSTMDTVKYDIGLSAVERPENAKAGYGEQKIVTLQEEDATKYSFEDDLIRIVWTATPEQLVFDLTNKTNHSIKIIWDKAVYIDENGNSERVMHSGVTYANRNNPQPPTTVARLATISDLVFPTENVDWVGGPYGGWRIKPLFPTSSVSGTSEDLLAKAKKYVGKSVQVLLPLEIEETVNEYIFVFKVNQVVIGMAD
jgi:hypothetical protein